MNVRIRTLTFEVTRRCQLRCEHCLRGREQDKNLSEEVVDKMLSQVSSIGELTFTGGEPTLNLPIIRYILEKVKNENIRVDGFFIATNGLENQMELAHMILEYMPMFDDPDYCSVAISRDMYHGTYKISSPVQYLACYSDVKEQPDEYNFKGLLNRGMAKENYLPNTYDRPYDTEFDIESYEQNGEVEVEIDLVYVCYNGTICADCDLPYEDMEYYSVTTVDDFISYVEEIIEKEEN